MIFAVFLHLFYFFFFAYAITRLSFFRDSGIGRLYLLLGYLVKVIGGFAYGYVYLHWYSGGDTWVYFDCSRLIYDSFYVDWRYYVQLVFGSCNYTPTDERFLAIIKPIAHWSDERTYFILRINAVLQWFSFGNYYVHVLFWVFFSMLGSVAYYRVFVFYFPNYTRWSYAVLFLQPSVVFWASGVHKDGLTLMALGLYVYGCMKILLDYKQLRYYCLIGLSVGMFYYFRPHLVALLVPCSIAWFWSEWFRGRALIKFGLLYVLSAVLLMMMSYYSMETNVFRKLMQIQYVFITYTFGKGDIPIPFLQPTWQSAFANIPMALYNALVSPTLYGFRLSIQHQLAALEGLFFLLLLAFGVFRWYLGSMKMTGFLYFCLFLSLSFLVLIGLTTDNIGALVRYRTTILPLLTLLFGLLSGFEDRMFGIKRGR